jgi:hypothetical protein
MEHEERQFEREMSPEESRIESMLTHAFATQTPEGLKERVANASQPKLLEACDEALERQLTQAFATTSPDGLADRVYATSVANLGEQHPVVAHIGRFEVWRQVALAASVVIAVFIAYQIAPQNNNQPNEEPLVANYAVLSIEDEELLFEDLNLSEYAYLADTRELAFADVAVGLAGLRDDIELWQYGLLSE